MTKKICAVIVTFNRIACLKKNLNCLFNQNIPIDKIIIINNNSNDGTKEYLDEVLYRHNNVIVKNLLQNIGGAGGFSEGVKTASELNDIDYIWGMDDDAYPKEDALENLLEYANEESCLWSNCNNDNDFNEKDYKKVTQWMFVGFFIPLNIVKKIGLPRKDFFIYFDDVEYARRIIKNGYNIFKIKNSVILHKDATNQKVFSRNIGNKQITLFALPDWKLYYYTRNHILLFKWNELEKYKLILWFILKFLPKLIFVNKKQLKIFLKRFY